MPSPRSCDKQITMQNSNEERTQGRYQHCNFRWQPPYGLIVLLIMLASWSSICQGAPFSSHVLRAEQELQLWNEIDAACSAVLSDSQLTVSSTLEELCFMVMGILQKTQGSEEKDDSKRSSVLHPLLQIVPQLHERRMKRFKPNEEVQGPGGVLSRGYFLFRPRNGRRSASFR
ncbi:PREDICTED: neuromedin-U isoform X2 [Nanorana parkeri]|uniref:neuromedin-U isoform X2 n=1 Tax=Nanorana parkeri TaxID=125878 RepID=UPI000854F34F|nr:PREDICTED: neuromedin-U isoform X2 [Nanorana parkeri]